MTRLKENSWTWCCIERRNCKLLATTVDRCQLLATLIPTSAGQIIPQQVGRYFQQFVPRSLSNHVFYFSYSHFDEAFLFFQKDPTGFTQAVIILCSARSVNVMGSLVLSWSFVLFLRLSVEKTETKDQNFANFAHFVNFANLIPNLAGPRSNEQSYAYGVHPRPPPRRRPRRCLTADDTDTGKGGVRGGGRRHDRSGKLDRGPSRMYRSQILQVNMRLKALAEIYTMHSFVQV